jgi:hypothetical protein
MEPLLAMKNEPFLSGMPVEVARQMIEDLILRIEKTPHFWESSAEEAEAWVRRLPGHLRGAGRVVVDNYFGPAAPPLSFPGTAR